MFIYPLLESTQYTNDKYHRADPGQKQRHEYSVCWFTGIYRCR